MRDHVRVTNLVNIDQPGGNPDPAAEKRGAEVSGREERRQRRSLERQAAKSNRKAARDENASRPPAETTQGRRQPPGSVWIDE